MFRETWRPIFRPQAERAAGPRPEQYFYCSACKHSIHFKTNRTQQKCLACGSDLRYLGQDHVGNRMAESLSQSSRHVTPNRLVMCLGAISPDVIAERKRIQELKKKALDKARKGSVGSDPYRGTDRHVS